MYQLKSCVWELTRACTMCCLHCGSQAGIGRERELSEAEAMDIADQLIGLGCRRVTLIGGEVTLCSYWSNLARYFADHGVTCGIVTNGYHKTDEDFAAIRNSHISSVALSVDGMESLHNQIRGRDDAFAEAGLFCKRLLDIQVPLTAVTTITRNCVDQLEELYAWLMVRGVQTWQWQQVSPMGNARDREALALRPDDIVRLFELYKALSTRRGWPPIVLADNLGYHVEWEGEVFQPFQGCPAGLSMIGLDSMGNVRGCESLYDERFIEGNLREQSLRDIWDSPDSFAYNRQFTPELLTGKCRRCEHGRRCAGGCRSFNSFHGPMYENRTCPFSPGDGMRPGQKIYLWAYPQICEQEEAAIYAGPPVQNGETLTRAEYLEIVERFENWNMSEDTQS